MPGCFVMLNPIICLLSHYYGNYLKKRKPDIMCYNATRLYQRNNSVLTRISAIIGVLFHLFHLYHYYYNYISLYHSLKSLKLNYKILLLLQLFTIMSYYTYYLSSCICQYFWHNRVLIAIIAISDIIVT